METPNTNNEMQNSAPTYADLFQQLQKTQRELSDKQITLDRVSAIGERNARHLREALETARRLISDANEDNSSFIGEHEDDINSLVALGMEGFNKTITVKARWVVTLDVKAEVPYDYDKDNIEIYMKEDIDDLFEGSFINDSDVESDSFDVGVELTMMNIYEEEY